MKRLQCQRKASNQKVDWKTERMKTLRLIVYYFIYKHILNRKRNVVFFENSNFQMHWKKYLFIVVYVNYLQMMLGLCLNLRYGWLRSWIVVSLGPWNTFCSQISCMMMRCTLNLCLYKGVLEVRSFCVILICLMQYWCHDLTHYKENRQ